MHGGGLELALVFLLAAVVAVPVFKRLGLGAVLGYLVAGALLGPHALRLVRDAEPVLAASEIGVVMLLFVIGLELSLPRLKLMRKPVFGVGGLQVLLSGGVLAALAMGGGFGWKAALIVGAGLALSSTAFGLQTARRAQGDWSRLRPAGVLDPAVPGPGGDPAARRDPAAGHLRRARMAPRGWRLPRRWPQSSRWCWVAATCCATCSG